MDNTQDNVQVSQQSKISSYVASILRQDTYKDVTKALNVGINARTSLIIKKMAEMAGKTEKEVASNLLEIAVDEAYKTSMDELKISDEDVKKYAGKIKSANRRKGKKRVLRKEPNTINEEVSSSNETSSIGS